MPRPKITGKTTCPRCRAVFRRRLQRCPLHGCALEPLPQDPLVGSVLGKRYAVERVTADGAAARCYASTDLRSGERCTVKMMYGEYAAVERYRRRFAREVEIGSRVCHPNVLAVIDAGATEAGVPFLVTIAVNGAPLSNVIDQHAPLGATRAARLVRDVAAGLDHIHARGFIHRGLTADAVLITHYRDSEAAIIADLGVACNIARDCEDAMGRITRAGKVVGVPAYMSPEQTADAPLDHRSDLYSLGVLLYQLLSGRAPFEGSIVELATQNFAEEAPPIAQRVRGLRVDERLERIAMKLLSKDPGKRFQSAADLLAVMEAPKLCYS